MSKFPTTRNITGLCSQMRSLYARFDVAMNAANISYIVTCTYRNDDDQNALYAQGRTATGTIVTDARAGESKHNVTLDDGTPASRAFDIVIMKNGKPDWDKKNPNWKIAGKIAAGIGLEWAGNWKSFQEYPHFQLPQGE